MASPMLQFIKIDRQSPQKREADDRRRDFCEIYRGVEPDRAASQASRCEQCGIPFCQIRCPLHNNIPDWLMMTATGRLREAYALARATNSLPEICGRICPQDRLCEGNCVLEQSKHGGVTIGAVERFITETAWDEGWITPITPERELAASVGIIGGGPAGLAAAAQLRELGYQVTIYDRHDRMGGLMMYGIPGFKLDKGPVQRRVDWLKDSGVTFRPNTAVGRDVTLADLRRAHNAVLIATGVYKSRGLGVPGSEFQGVEKALDYLIAANKVQLGDTVEDVANGRLDARGKNVVVVGGGDTAMDCLRTAVRQGAASVTCLYRRDRANMPGSQKEVANAMEEGVVFDWLSVPVALNGGAGAGARVSSVSAMRMALSVADASGRKTPKPVPGSDFTLPADLVIEALGFEPEDMATLMGEPTLSLTKWGTVSVDAKSWMTSLDGVFAAGDIVRGASLVVWAIRDAHAAADGIHRYLVARADDAAGAADASLVKAS